MMNSIKLCLFLTIFLTILDINVCDPTTDNLSTIEPEPSTGCPAPDLRFTRPRRIDLTTESPYAEFETTQIYLPEDFTTSDIEIIEKVDIDLNSGTLDEGASSSSHKYAEINPYRIDSDGTDQDVGLHEEDGEHDLIDGQDVALTHQLTNNNNRRRGKKRRFTGGKRRRVENEHGGRGGGRGGRYQRSAIYEQVNIDEKQSSEILKLSKHENQKKYPLPPIGKVYYIEAIDLLRPSKETKKVILEKKLKTKIFKNGDTIHIKNINNHNYIKNMKKIDTIQFEKIDSSEMNKNKFIPNDEEITMKSKHHVVDNNNFNNGTSDKNRDDIKDVEQHEHHKGSEHNNGTILSNFDIVDVDHVDDDDIEVSNQMENQQNNGNESATSTGNENNDQNTFSRRVKRKSGKTTGALSRPKGGSDSGSKSTSRKEKGGFDEEGGYVPVHSEDEDEEEEEEKSESAEHSHFSEVSEIRFPGEVGPLGDRRLCKIRCSKGKWVGPLCATNEEDDHGNVKFQPLYKSCHVNRIPPHLLLSYRNISVNVGWDLPHGHSLQARCKDLGLYKLLGESRVLCSNGLWAPRMPSCVPTTLLTNYSDDSPPSIRIKIGVGSGAFEPSGVLAVLPGSTIHLDCMYPRRRGNPEWTWTGWFNQANPVGWSTIPDEKGIKYRLTIKDIQNQDSGTYTCASPRGLTNSIVIVVATSQCPQLPDSISPLSLRLEGNKLGQRALYRCPLGYTIEGTANSTCLASGNWSSPPPTCHPVQCPPLFLEDPHLSLTELNTSAWGRAVFKCSWGFRLSGPPGLECEPTGVWSGPVPRCRAIQCPQPLVPINGRIDGTSGSSSHRRYAVGALVTFSCTEGHLLVGEASIVCTETGFWSHPPPFCKSQCPYPGDPPNGLIAPLKFHYDPGDLLSVQCRPGFVEYSASGPPERPRCLPDGNWSGSVPQCRSYEEV